MTVHRAGSSVEDFCRVCKEPRDHRVIAVGSAGEILRVICGYCGSQHNFRGGRVPGERPRSTEASGPTVIRRGGESASAPSGQAREGLVSARERLYEPVSDWEDSMDLEMLLRRVIREEMGVTPVAPAEKWRGGELILKPGKPGLQEKSIPIETFFHKVVMIRNRLRVLEQQINASNLPDDEKIKLQSYVTGAYGSLTTLNVLFADEGDKFKGSGGD
jgi:hypothetical protein